jgi:hypothetical protein
MQAGFPSHAVESTSTLLTISSLPTLIADINSFRDSFCLTNTGDVPVYINYGKKCDTVIYMFRLKPNAIFSDDFDGTITACTANATGYLVLTEKY